MAEKTIIVEDPYMAFERHPDYLNCIFCGRSSRWYSGITKESHWFDKDLQEEFTASKFICIFCESHTEEGSDESIVLYGTAMGGKHTFLKEIPLP